MTPEAVSGMLERRCSGSDCGDLVIIQVEFVGI